MRKLTRGSKIFNGVLALPLVGIGIMSMFLGAWQGALVCFALAIFIFWVWPTITGNLKALLHERLREVAATISESNRSTRSSASSPRAVDEGPAPERVDGTAAGTKRSHSTAPSQLANVVAQVSGLNRTKKRIILGVGVAVVVLIVVAPVVTNSVRSARDRQLQRNYARGEAEYLARLEAETARDNAEPDNGFVEPAAGADDNLTPNGHNRWMQLPDIIGTAPADGSVRRAAVVYTADGGDAGSFILEVQDTEIGGTDPTYVHDVQLFEGEMGQYCIDDKSVSLDDFYSFIGSESAETNGSIEFTQDAFVRSNAYSNDYVPSGSP